MAIDTVKLKSPSIDASLARKIEAQCILRSGKDLSTGEILYEITTGSLLGSWDSRISLKVMREEYESRGQLPGVTKKKNLSVGKSVPAVSGF